MQTGVGRRDRLTHLRLFLERRRRGHASFALIVYRDIRLPSRGMTICDKTPPPNGFEVFILILKTLIYAHILSHVAKKISEYLH